MQKEFETYLKMVRNLAEIKLHALRPAWARTFRKYISPTWYEIYENNKLTW